MFTGIIQAREKIIAVERRGGDVHLRLRLGSAGEGVKLGDSIACNGICLTVAELRGSGTAAEARFVAAPETQRKTTLGTWRTGQVLNLEPALAFGDRLGGHLVSGHVDGIGTFVSKTPEGDGFRMYFELPKDGSVKVVEKGSIAIDGISLTTWDCTDTSFSVAVIPHTLKYTSLGDLRPGSSINLEMDLIARWVEKMLPQ
jgi:riboflavin synthase